MMQEAATLPLCEWRVASDGDVPECAGLPKPIVRLIRDRDLADVTDASAVSAFVDASMNGLSAPEAFPGVADAAKAISETIDAGGQIVVFGDYDCDGVTATAILVALLRGLGANAVPFIPERSEGYGLTDAAVSRCMDEASAAMPEAPCRLLVTVDCGMGAGDALRRFLDAGYRVVVSDHHTPGSPLPAECVVVSNFDPAVPPQCRYLCGAGLAFKIAWAAVALRHPLPDRTLRSEIHSWMGPLAVATVADVVPLVGENRVFVREGLSVMNRRPPIGIKALVRKAFSRMPTEGITAYHLGFVFGPHVNAAGRMGSASVALGLLLAKDDDDALERATRLASLNSQRKMAEDVLLKDIDRQLEAGAVFDASSDAAAVFAGRGWHHGVVGLAAGRLCERLARPVAVLSVDDEGLAHGSARAPVDACNLYNVLDSCSSLLVRFGGHSGAAGLSLREADIPAFRKAFTDECRRQVGGVRTRRTLDVAGVLSSSDLTPELLDALQRLEPFGASNEKPLWLFEGVSLSMFAMGREKTHLRLSLRRDDGLNLGAVWFGAAKYERELASCELWDVVGELSVNEYRGDTEIQLFVHDARPAERS